MKDGGVLPCPGNLDDWCYHQRQLAEAAAAAAVPAAAAAAGPAAPGAGERAGPPARSRPRRATRATGVEKPLREEIARLEARIEALEAEEREATAALADPALYEDFARAKPLIDRQRAAKEELATRYAEWESAHERLAALGPG